MLVVQQKDAMQQIVGGENVSYVEHLLGVIILASVIISGVMFGIGWLIAKLIENKGDI